jgi:hypothetical protein
MIKLISFFIFLCPLYGFSADPFKGMSEEEKIKSYEKIKIEILQRWTCNYFFEEVNEYMLDRNKKNIRTKKKYFYEYPLHFYGARDDQAKLTNEILSRKNVPKKFWDTSNIEVFKIKDLPCQEKIQQRNLLKEEFEQLKNKF